MLRLLSTIKMRPDARHLIKCLFFLFSYSRANKMNIEKARFNMIEQQIRPWDVLDLDAVSYTHLTLPTILLV